MRGINTLFDKIYYGIQLSGCLVMTNPFILVILLIIFISQTYQGGWILLFISGITIPPSLTALYATEKWVVDNKYYGRNVIGYFFRCYINNFKRSFIFGSIFLVLSLILLVDILVISSGLRVVFLFLFTLVVGIYLIGTYYVSQSDFSVKETIKMTVFTGVNAPISLLTLTVISYLALYIGIISNLFISIVIFVLLTHVQLKIVELMIKKLPILDK